MNPIYLVNKVLIQPDKDNTLSDGVLVATHNTRHYHYSVTGTVIKAPAKLVCEYKEYIENRKSKSQRIQEKNRDITRHSLPFMPNGIEIKEGDRVMFQYVTRMNQEKEEMPILLLNYTDIFCILDINNNPTPINGYLIASPNIEADNYENFLFESKQSDHFFDIEYASKFKNEGYLTDRPYIESDVCINDRVMIKKSRYRILNHPFHPVINNTKPLIAFHRKDIVAKLQRNS